jgi:hypothetical protein
MSRACYCTQASQALWKHMWKKQPNICLFPNFLDIFLLMCKTRGIICTSHGGSQERDCVSCVKCLEQDLVYSKCSITAAPFLPFTYPKLSQENISSPPLSPGMGNFLHASGVSLRLWLYKAKKDQSHPVAPRGLRQVLTELRLLTFFPLCI